MRKSLADGDIVPAYADGTKPMGQRKARTIVSENLPGLRTPGQTPPASGGLFVTRSDNAHSFLDPLLDIVKRHHVEKGDAGLSNLFGESTSAMISVCSMIGAALRRGEGTG